MDFGILGALTGLVGAGLSASNQAAQQNIEWANLMFQKQQAAKQERMSSAARTDAFGNKQFYDPISNQWVVELTPTQKQITNAGEQEQLQSLTTDAVRKRQLAQRQEQRSLQAEAPYHAAFEGYMYDQPHSEAATRSDLETLMLMANQDNAKQNQDSLARQAIRLGRGADIPKLIKATDDQLGSTTSGTMLQALQAAQQTHAAQTQQHDQQDLPELAQWQKIIDDGGGASEQRFSDVPQQLDAIQGQQQSGMLGAINAAAQNIGNAYKGLATSAGAASPFADLAKSIGKIGESASKSSGSKAKPKYSLTNTSDPWGGNEVDWGSTPDYMNNIDWGAMGGPGGFDMSNMGLGDFFG